MFGIILFASSNPLNDLGVMTLSGSIDLDNDLSKIAGKPMTMELTAGIDLTMELISTPPPVTSPLPPRYMIWVYNLAGERVDVIA